MENTRNVLKPESLAGILTRISDLGDLEEFAKLPQILQWLTPALYHKKKELKINQSIMSLFSLHF